MKLLSLAFFICTALPAQTTIDWSQIRNRPATPGAVDSVAGRTGTIVLSPADIVGLVAALGLKAPLASPIFTGQPTITDFTLAGHTHLSTTSGGTLTASAITAGVFGIGRIPTGTTTGTVAAGNDARFTDSRAPNGSAAGDLGGSYPSPDVLKIHGNSVPGIILSPDGVFITTSPGNFAAKFIPECSSAGEVLQYITSTHSFRCHTLVSGDIPGGGGALSWASLTNGNWTSLTNSQWTSMTN